MNRKGFTLIELLAVIVLIGLLFGLAVPGINKISSNVEKRKEKKVISLIENAAILYGQDHKTMLREEPDCNIIIDGVSKEVYCKKVTVETLIEEEYFDTTDNTYNKYKGYCVYIYKNNNRVYAKYDTSNVCP